MRPNCADPSLLPSMRVEVPKTKSPRSAGKRKQAAGPPPAKAWGQAAAEPALGGVGECGYRT